MSLSIAGDLVGRPRLLILDEPSEALDRKYASIFFELLVQLHQQEGMAIILVTHDISEIGHYATQMLYLDRALTGKIVHFCLCLS